MDYNEAKQQAFCDELEKMGGWPAIAAVASRALPAVMSVGSKLMKGVGGKAGAGLMGASMLAGKKGGQAAVKKPGFFSSIFSKRPRPPVGPRY